MAQKKILIRTAMNMLKKCTCVAEWNNTREYLQENMSEDRFDALFSVIESTGFISKVLESDEYGIKLIEDYIKKNFTYILKEHLKKVNYE